MKDWVVPFLRMKGDPNISSEELDRDLQIPIFCYQRLAGCFRIITPRFYDRERLLWLTGFVLSNIPEDIFLTLRALNLMILSMDGFGGATMVTNGALINLSRVLTLRDDLATAVIVHEVAHTVGGELFGTLNAVDDLEKRSDDLASEWGFQQEIDALRAYFDEKEENNYGRIGKAF